MDGGVVSHKALVVMLSALNYRLGFYQQKICSRSQSVLFL